MNGALIEVLDEIRGQAEVALELARELAAPVRFARLELRDLLKREFAVDADAPSTAIWLENVIDDIAAIVTRPYVETAGYLAGDLGGLVYDATDEEEERRRVSACLDCSTDTFEIGEYYMVVDTVWLAANPDEAGMLCIGCLEMRLGRQLRPDDFLPVEMNRSPHRSPRMRARVLGLEEAPAA
jgi:hypothetical protein